MQLPCAQLPAQLQRGLKPLYVLHGDELLLQQEAAAAVRQAAKALGPCERSVHVVQGAHFNWSEVLAASAAQSLFADRQILELRLPSGKPGKDGAVALQKLAESCGEPSETLVLITLPRLDAATQKSAWFSALDSFGVVVRCDPIERHALPQWIAQRLAQQGQSVPRGEEGQRSLQFFADRVEGHLLAAHQEVQKLALLYPAGELTAAQIEAAVLNVARYDVFKLSEAVLTGQYGRLQRMLEGLRAEGEAEVLVHWSLSEDIRTLYRVRCALDAGQPMPMALREARVWGQKEKWLERALPRLSASQLGQLLWAAHQVDGLVKGLKLATWPTNAWQALGRLAFALARACQGADPDPFLGQDRGPSVGH